MQPIDPKEFEARWREWYPDVDPHGWAIQALYPHRWLRIHSLPASKRLPETESDYVTILERHNAVASAIVGTAECVLIGYDYDGVYSRPPKHPLAALLPAAPAVMRLAPDDDDESEPISLFAGRDPWYPGMLDHWLREVADDRLRLMLLNWDTGAAYAPYDGGADLFWPSETLRDRARDAFSSWRSSDPSGL